MKIQVIACDIDRKVPAQTYTIETDDGRKWTKDLCTEHAEPIERLIAEFEGVEPKSETKPEPKKAAKKAPARRRPRVTTLEEIEASKKS
ncbi:DNA binding protein [Streptomyces phage Hank144]|uniref:DNA binding protein n=1 Tax=Streptomyces phage Hank144 TaxID=2301573 RepID=A0A385DRF1_9CAUD|nr:hypothetical protein KGG76_gp29 [Streptomyces phage Hank144]AXQ61085.1 DNA binding protein [Streptomyces phage Hank144]